MINEDFIDAILLSFDAGIIKKLVFSRPARSEISKVTGRLCEHRGGRLLALEYSLPGNTVSHKNIQREGLAEAIGELLSQYRQANLLTTLSDVEWKISKSGKTVVLGLDKLTRRLSGDAPEFEQAIEALDNRKNYILTGGEEFLIKLGISDKSGRVHDKRQGKFRQINRFLEHIEDVYPSLSSDGRLTVYDLCCGKSYLSFAVYYYLTEVKKREVSMLGIDLKRDVIRWCDTLASSLGFVGMKFITGDVVRDTPRKASPDLVISLHACDIATDVVINRGADLRARVILSTPCCHRYLNDKISPEALPFVTAYPHFRNKLCEVLTDSIRVARLRSLGYEVSAVELTDPDDTPKNTLIRAIRNDSITDAELDGRRAEYEGILSLVLGDKKNDYLKEI